MDKIKCISIEKKYKKYSSSIDKIQFNFKEECIFYNEIRIYNYIKCFLHYI